jgi:signal transduction histidine kinase
MCSPTNPIFFTPNMRVPETLRIRSLRARLIFSFVATTMLMLTAFATFSAWSLHRGLLSAVDERLHQDYEMASLSLSWDSQRKLRLRNAAHFHLPGEQEQEPLIEIRNSIGADVLFFDSGGVDVQGVALPPFTKNYDYRTVILANGHRARTVTKPITIEGVDVVIRVFRGIDRVYEDTAALLRVYALAIPLALALGYFASRWVANRLIHPIAELSAAMQTADVRSLATRVDPTAFDIELAQLAERYNAMLARIEQGVSTLERFSADVAHELRTPLMAIVAKSESALFLGKRDSAGEALRTVLEDARHLSGMVDRLLQLARADRGDLRLSCERVEALPLLQEVAELMRPLADENERSIEVKRDPSKIAATALADRHLIRQVLIDLIDNALKHGAGAIELSARVRSPDATAQNDSQSETSASHVNGFVEIDVADRGVGIAANDRAHAISRFGRLDAARSKLSEGGYGLGLAIAKALVEAHRGTLTLASREGGGLIARIRLPAAP